MGAPGHLSAILSTGHSEPGASSGIEARVNAIESSGLANAAREYRAAASEGQGRPGQRRAMSLEELPAELQAPLQDYNRLAIEIGDRERARLLSLGARLGEARRELEREASAARLAEALESAGAQLDDARREAGEQLDALLKSAGRHALSESAPR